MKKITTLLGYFALINVVVLIDRATKNVALLLQGNVRRVNQYLSFEYAQNKGISWGMLHASNAWAQMILVACIASIIIVLALHAAKRFNQGHSIIGEILVLCGACSNLFDRIMHGGVIDFIALSYKHWAFPIFNVADICIVLGSCIMLFTMWRSE